MSEAASAELEREVKDLIVECLGIDDVNPEDIDAEAPLAGDDDGGLGLDSIDFLEIALAVERRWNVKAQAADSDNERIYRSVRSLATYVAEQRSK